VARPGKSRPYSRRQGPTRLPPLDYPALRCGGGFGMAAGGLWVWGGFRLLFLLLLCLVVFLPVGVLVWVPGHAPARVILKVVGRPRPSDMSIGLGFLQNRRVEDKPRRRTAAGTFLASTSAAPNAPWPLTFLLYLTSPAPGR